MSPKNQKWQRLIAFIFFNAIQYPRTLENIYHSNIRGPPPFFHLGTNSVIGHALVHSFDKTHVIVVTVDLIWLLLLLNIISFNFVATPRKSLRFTSFIRSYVNRPAFVLTNHYQSYTALLLYVRSSKFPCSIFLQLFVPNDGAFAMFSTPVARTDGSADEQM